MSTFTAADVGKSIDVLIDGQGYVYDDTIDPTSVYSSRQRAQFGLSPVFVQRSNVQGDYGDSQQDFFLTFTQRDWSLGEQQKYVRPNDADSARRYRLGSDIDIHTPGQVSMAFIAANPTAAAGIQAMGNLLGDIWIFSTTNAYKVNTAGTLGSAIAHGVGNTPDRYAVTQDGDDLYVSSNLAGGTVRVFNGATFNAFSASGAAVLCYLNNTLYGFRESQGDLVRWDTAGVLTSLFTWKDSAGGQLRFPACGIVCIEPYGGKLLILHSNKLWLSEGAAPEIVAALPADFVADSLTVSLGIAYVGGVNGYGHPAIMYYANGELGMLWESDSTTLISVAPQLVPFRNGIFFSDPARGAFYYYNGGTGGVSIISEYSVGTQSAPMMATSEMSSSGYIAFAQNRTGTDLWTWPAYSGSTKQYVATSVVFSSLIDFDSSLNKNFHSVKLDFDLGTDGNGGSVDIAYRINDVNSSYTSLVTGAVSGTEYTLTGVSGRSISIAITIHRGTSTTGPVLKRMSVRGSPVQPQYFRSLYTLACYGSDRPPEPKRQPLRDVDSHLTKTGSQMVADLRTAAAKTAPISITDEVNGTYTGIIEPDNFNVDRIRPGEYRVQLVARSV